MKHYLAIILIAAVAVCVSCGQKHTAKVAVEQFLEANLKDGAPSNLDIENLDSTNFLADSTIVVLRQQAEKTSLYKAGVTYAERPARQKLVWAVATFDNGGKPIRHTFYLTRDCQQVVAVKP